MKKLWLLILAVCMACTMAACGSEGGQNTAATENTQQQEETTIELATISAPEIEGLTYHGEVELDYAETFRIFEYEDDYSVICVDDGRNYLLVPEDGTAPEQLGEEFTVLYRPLDKIYLVATSAMSLFDAVDAVDSIRFSGTKEDGWYIDSAIQGMQDGSILYAGKYSEPDYETILAEGCDLAVESTMILHSPEVIEKLAELDIPVFIDRSSYESHPLGRVEWLKLYGELTGKQEEAKVAFDEQKAYVENIENIENTGKTVAFFYVNQSGIVVTRKTNDYLPRMIELAGGKYIFDELGEDDDSAMSSINMSMEEFYADAQDADYIIYNATIEAPLNSIDELLETSELFADFKAVKEGHVWCTDKYLYQGTSILGSMVQDIHTILTDESAEQLTFMYRLH